MDDASADTQTTQETHTPKHWFRSRAGIALIVLGLLAILGAVTALAVYQGLQDRAALARQNAEAHYEAGLAHMRAGETDLAIAEFELALRLAPDHSEARAQLAKAQRARAAVGTPTSEVYQAALDGLFAQAVDLYNRGDWMGAAAAFEHIATLDPGYRPKEIQQYRFDCYRLQGEALEAENRLEEAIRAYDQALRVRPSAADIARKRELLALYSAGAGAAGADWGRCVEAFRQLYAVAPAFRDVAQRLYEAYVGHGDACMGWGLWCQAEEAYEAAKALDDNPTIRARLNDASQRCAGLAEAALTPVPTRPAEPPILSELPFGRLLFGRYDDARKTYDIMSLDAGADQALVLVRSANQPATSPDGQRLAYHSTDKTAPGIFVMDLQSGKRWAISTSARDSRPFWSPDGSQVAFIRDANSPTAMILAAPADGSGKPEPLANGWSAAWSSTNHLALTGCDETQTECGIFVEDLSRGGRIRFTADKNDIGLAWSPDGSHVAYVSSHDGNWEIYTVRIEGGFVRRCTVNAADDGMPTWSPDGRQIAFVSNRDGVWTLYVMLADGSEQRKIMDLSMSNPDWISGQMAWLP
ncbi:MAG: tetratricopeptide repeat protein [Anaerolineae bacterium]|jgi:TolB protein|nr:tetratricopeptide repeat protein [Anaerolineae bacterium]